VPQQVCNPFGVRHIRLPAPEFLEVLRVDHEYLELPVQYVVDRFPIDARTFHRHMRDRLLGKPLRQCFQITRHRAKRARHFDWLAVRPRHNHTGHHGFLVNINPTTAFILDLHRTPPQYE